MVLAVAGCGQTATPGGRPSPSPTQASAGSPPPVATSAAADVWRLRYALLRHYPDFAYCDPDLYPVARGDQQSAADRWWAGVPHSSPEVSAILAQHGYREPLSADQRRTAYGDHERANVVA